MTGILYGVGVGPGDPELMTLKAVRLIRQNDVIAVPGKVPENTTAYRIAVQAVPELKEKKLLAVDFPMTRDLQRLEEKYRENARVFEKFLASGKNVVFLTLGDATIYSTFSYVQRYVRQDGYEAEFVSAVPSFIAAAAAMKEPLVERDEPLHIYPALYPRENPQTGKTGTPGATGIAGAPGMPEITGISGTPEIPGISETSGTCVLMKAGSSIREIRKALQKSARRVWMVENCGMPDEKIYEGAENLPEQAGYYSIVVTKNKNNE